MSLPHVLHNVTELMKTDIALIAMRDRESATRSFNDHFKSIRDYVIETDGILEAEAEVITSCGRYIGHLAERPLFAAGEDMAANALKQRALQSITDLEQALMAAQPSRTAHALGLDW